MSSGKEILVVVPRAPWPARRDGFAVRYHPLLDYLSRRHSVDLCLVAEEHPNRVAAGARTLCRELFILNANVDSGSFSERWRTRVGVLNPFSVPYHIRKFGSARLADEILDIAARKPYRTILWVSSEYMEAAEIVRRRNRRCRFVLDLVDSPALYYRRKARQQSEPRLIRTIVAWQIRRLERRWRSLADQVIYISPTDVAESGCEPPDYGASVIPNGLLVDGSADVQPALAGPPALGFLGNMAYPPNIEAVTFLHDRIFRALKDRHPQLRLIIIGRDPARSVRELAARDVIVTGGVEDIWPYVSSVDIFVFPMFMGAGLQNKILEAMAASRPVVTTSICARPLGSEAADYLSIGDTAEQLVATIDELLQQPSRARDTALEASRWVREQFDWDNILPRYERTLLAHDND